MTPSQAIVAATKNGAAASRAMHDLGTVEKGKRADLLVVDGDPTRELSMLAEAQCGTLLVMKAGRIVRNRLPAA